MYKTWYSKFTPSFFGGQKWGSMMVVSTWDTRKLNMDLTPIYTYIFSMRTWFVQSVNKESIRYTKEHKPYIPIFSLWEHHLYSQWTKESIRNTKEHKAWTSRLNQLKTSPEPKSYLKTLQDCCLPVQQDTEKVDSINSDEVLPTKKPTNSLFAWDYPSPRLIIKDPSITFCPLHPKNGHQHTSS